MSRIDIGPHTHKDDAGETFDREVNVRAIAWTVGLLVAVTLVVHVIIYGLIVGFNRFDDQREPRRSPVAEANRQEPPPLPRLQTAPERELKELREEEDRLLGNIDQAMEEIAERGLGPEVVGGTALTPVPSPTSPTPSPGEGRPLPSQVPVPPSPGEGIGRPQAGEGEGGQGGEGSGQTPQFRERR